jgi:uncharacterized membrane protein YbhN (UPF0104 family)
MVSGRAGHPFRGPVAWALRVVVAFALLGFLAWKAGLGAPDALSRISWTPVVLGLLLVPVAVAIRAYNHILLVNRRTRVLSPSQALRLAFVGAGLALVLPAGAADAAKAHYGFRVHGHAEDMIVSSMLDKVTSVVAVAFMGALGGLAAGETTLALVALGIGLVGLLPFVAPRLVPWRLVMRVLAPGHAPDDDLVNAASRPPLRLLVSVLAVSVAGWLVSYLIVALACAGVGAEIPLGYVFALAPLATIARLVPVSVGGIGLGEVTTAALLVRAGVAQDLAARATLLAMVLTVLVPGAVGLALVTLRRHQRTSAMSQGSDVETVTSEK